MIDKDTAQEKQTIELLQKLKETPSRDPGQEAEGRRSFLTQAQQISDQPVSIPVFQRLMTVFTQPRPQLRFSTLTIGIILSVLLLTFSSSAYAARRSKPDQIFYPFKLWLENSRLSLTTQPDEQIDLHLVFAEERLNELASDANYSASGIGQAKLNLSIHLEALRSLLGEDQDHNGRQVRMNAILDRYEQMEDQEQNQEEQEIENSSGTGQDNQENPSEKDEDQEGSEDDDDHGKHKNDHYASPNAQGTEEPSDDDKDEDHETEAESTEESDDDHSDDDHSDDDPPDDPDPTETPEPDDDD